MAFTLVPLSIRHDSSIAVGILGCIAGLFLLFAVRTALRFLTLVEVTSEEISCAPVGPWSPPIAGLRPVRLAWSNIDRMSLRFFSTARDRSEGWMVLSFGSGNRRMKLESTLDGFLTIVARGARAAVDNGVKLSSPTIQNLRALGIATSSERF